MSSAHRIASIRPYSDRAVAARQSLHRSPLVRPRWPWPAAMLHSDTLGKLPSRQAEKVTELQICHADPV